MKRHRSILLFVTIGLLPMAGCATVGVKPWQHDLLAREEMRLDANQTDRAWDEHVYFSKEATSGGRGFGGGGCGCN